MFCDNCGTQLRTQAKFCDSCGQPTRTNAAIASPARNTVPSVKPAQLIVEVQVDARKKVGLFVSWSPTAAYTASAKLVDKFSGKTEEYPLAQGTLNYHKYVSRGESETYYVSDSTDVETIKTAIIKLLTILYDQGWEVTDWLHHVRTRTLNIGLSIGGPHRRDISPGVHKQIILDASLESRVR